jgi:DnaA regulatory inactivator Hda
MIRSENLGAQLRLKLERERSFKREDFILSEANRYAVNTLDRWPRWHGQALALVGPSGSGKTHLATDWARKHDALTLSHQNHAEQLIEVSDRPRPVLIEDADRFDDEEALFHLFNLALQPGGGLLLTGQSEPASWKVSLPDLRSRLNATEVAELGPPDDDILLNVLRRLFRERNIKANDELLAYLMRRISRSVPEAEKVVAQLDEAADTQQRPVTRALARQILELEPDLGDLFADL